MTNALPDRELAVRHVRANDPRWTDFVTTAKPTLFQSPSWGSLIESVYGFENMVAVAQRGASIVAGLPYAVVEDFRGRRFVSYAFADVCESLGDSEAFAAIEADLAQSGVPWQVRSRVQPGPLAQSVAEVGVHQRLPLSGSPAEILARCHPKQRANVRQAEAVGLESRVATIDEAAGLYYVMHSRVRKKKHRLLPQPRSFFEEIVRCYFPDRGILFVAEARRVAVAAMLFLREGSTWYYKFSASDQDSLDLRPNHFLLWRAIEAAIEAGVSEIDLGISEDDGLIRFKQRFGAKATPVYAGKYGQWEKTPEVQAIEATLAAITRQLTDPEAPIEAAQAGGNALYRYFV